MRRRAVRLVRGRRLGRPARLALLLGLALALAAPSPISVFPPSQVTVLCRDVTAKTFTAASPASVNEVFRCSVPGGTLGTNRGLRLTVYGVANTNGATTPHHNIEVFYGATELMTLPAVETLAVNLVATPWIITVDILARGTATTQSAAGVYVEPTGGSGGDGGSTSAIQHHYGSHSTVAIDSQVAQDVVVNWNWPGPTFDAADSITYVGGMLEALR